MLPFMAGSLQSYTVVVVSDEDFKAHVDGTNVSSLWSPTFTIRTSERSTNEGVVNLEIPIDVEEVVFTEFGSFVYFRKTTRIAKLAPPLLLPLLRLADYYNFESLSRAVLNALETCYSSLTNEMPALQVSKTMHFLGLENGGRHGSEIHCLQFRFCGEVGDVPRAIGRQDLWQGHWLWCPSPFLGLGFRYLEIGRYPLGLTSKVNVDLHKFWNVVFSNMCSSGTADLGLSEGQIFLMARSRA